MSDKCFICVESASNRYTVILDQSKCLEQNLICDDCITDLEQEEWIELSEEPPDSRGPDTMPI
jgi:hypothetical protein